MHLGLFIMFKELDEFPGYSVNEEGQVKGPKGRVLKPAKNTQGYLYVSCCKNGKQFSRFVHQLVAAAFIENPEGKREVNHQNGIKTDNRVENLEWSTGSENRQHAFDTGLHSHPKTPIIATHVKTGEQIRFESQHEAERNGFMQCHINHALRGRAKTHGGYTWQYA